MNSYRDLDVTYNEESAAVLGQNVLLALIEENDVAPRQRRVSAITGRVVKARVAAMLKRVKAEREAQVVPA